jgi:hypothetical protein
VSQQLDLFSSGDTKAGRAIREAADDLPPIAREMVTVMGQAATMALVHEMGGLRLLVPGWPLKRPSSRYQHLEEIVGPEAAQAFATRWGNIEVQVPMAKKALMRLRDRGIVDAYAKGVHPPELARRHGISERHVWKVLKRDSSA